MNIPIFGGIVLAEKLPTREQIDAQHRWNLEDIYATDKLWEEDVVSVDDKLQVLKAFRGKLTTAEQLLRCLQLSDELGMMMEKIVAYAAMRLDEDNTNSDYQKKEDKASSLQVKVASELAFIEPEILALPDKRVREWIDNTPALKNYRHGLENILRRKPHTLPTEQEELLASAGEMARAASNIYDMFNDADLSFPVIEDGQGEEVQLTHARYGQLIESRKRQVRKAAFQAMYTTYDNWKNTLATAYTSAVKSSLFYAKARKYESTLAEALDGDNVPPEVYHNLIDTVHQHLPAFYRYMKLRKQRLAVDELHMYDIHVPIVSDVDMKIDFNQAQALVLEGLQPLGETYLSDLQQGFDTGWIDWFESRGKTSGAYSWGAYGVHPFVLMNYQDNIDNMFTLAHEMGHALHSYYSDKHQEYANSHYTIFTAEVASTVNECLVMAHLLEKTKDPKEKMYLLNHYLEQFRGTLFRQTMFAEFELMVHESIRQGHPQTADSLCEIYHELNKKYFGPDVINDEEIAVEWARIPHFYDPFYVYKYATGFSAAVALSQQILSGGQDAVRSYLEFLQSGGSDYPLDLLKKAGVDMTSAQPIVAAMELFDSLVDQFKELV